MIALIVGLTGGTCALTLWGCGHGLGAAFVGTGTAAFLLGFLGALWEQNQ